MICPILLSENYIAIQLIPRHLGRVICYSHLVQQYAKSPHVDFRSYFYCLALAVTNVGKYFRSHVALSSTSLEQCNFPVTLYFVGHTKIKNFDHRFSLRSLFIKTNVLWFQVAVNYLYLIMKIIKSLQNLMGKFAKFAIIFNWRQPLYLINNHQLTSRIFRSK